MSYQGAISIVTFQVLVFVLFCVFGKYGKYNDYYDGKYGMFQDIHVMMFFGFGFLMTFLKRYGFSSVGFNFLLASLVVQWAILCQGFFDLSDGYKIEIGIESLYRADIAAATILISMGGVLGRTSYLQLIYMGIFEIVIYTANLYLGSKILKVTDAGGSIFVHSFGAYFGLAASYMINRGSKDDGENPLEGSRYTSDLFSMAGTIFLWLFWPSFNAVELNGDDQHRAVINTYLCLASCCVTTFASSLILSEEKKFDMVHIQNATLAGGVAVGASANLMLEPYGAVLLGIAAGALSTYGYSKITPFLTNNWGIRDTCGIHNLHGIPAILGGLVSVIMAASATEAKYGKSLYEIFPARATVVEADSNTEYLHFPTGDGRTAWQQAGYQMLALVLTVVIAIVSGILTGFILTRWFKYKENLFDDAPNWKLPLAAEYTTPFVMFRPTATSKKRILRVLCN